MPSKSKKSKDREKKTVSPLDTSTSCSLASNEVVTSNDLEIKFSTGVADEKEEIRRGSFYCPSGAHYEGEFFGGYRNGCGTQTWQNGSEYKGEFLNDMQHGIGVHKWKSGEVYEGQFYKDHRHGKGSYTWPDGTKYSGTFFLDKKEGYGVFTFSNGDRFEGLYKEDERFGPGVLTYKDIDINGQDVGIWHREKLLKVCNPTSNVFTMLDHPEYEYFPKEHWLNIDLNNDYESDIHKVFVNESSQYSFLSSEFKSSLFAENTALPPGIASYSKDFEHLPLTKKHMKDLEKAFFGSDDYKAMKLSTKDQVVSQNNTPLLMEIQKHTYKHRNRSKVVSFDIKRIESFQRTGFRGKPGHLEVMSQSLVESATKGDYHTVYSILKTGLVDPNVADSTGNMALIGAAVNCHHDIVNLLLDSGANVNQLNDEGVSALTACHIFYYPVDHFKPNQPERAANANRKLIQKNLTAVKKPEPIIRRATSPSAIAPKAVENFQKRHSQDESREKRDTMLIFAEHFASHQKVTSHSDVHNLLQVIGELPPGNDAEQKNIETCKSDVRIIKAHRETLSAKARKSSFDEKIAELMKHEGIEPTNHDAKTEASEDQPTFHSDLNQIDFNLDVTDELIEQTATLLSMNQRAVSGVSTRDGRAINLGTTAALAVWKAEHEQLRSMINLLLQRGADPNVGTVPYPALFFAVKAGDIEAVKTLLDKGATTEHRLSDKFLGLTMLHIACGIMCPEGVEIVAMLLNAKADPNAVAKDEDVPYTLGKRDNDGDSDYEAGKSFANKEFLNFDSQWITDGLKLVHESGRTPIHVACDRDDDYESARKIVRLLLMNGASPDVIWSGHSPLSMAVASGNDKAIDELLAFGADASLPLTRGVGNVLCATADPKHENRRTLEGRLKLIDKLIDNGASILAPVSFGAKKLTGTVVDYAHWMFVTDKRIAHTPYHALSVEERATYTARKHIIAHLGDLLREAAVKMENSKLREEFKDGVKNSNPRQVCRFLYTGAGAKPHSTTPAPTWETAGGATSANWMHKNPIRALRDSGTCDTVDEVLGVPVSRVSFVRPYDGEEIISAPDDKQQLGNKEKSSRKRRRSKIGPTRKPLFRYCHDCGRSVGVHLTSCSRCHEVFFCSRACKMKSWEERHKNECLRLKGFGRQSPMPTPSEIAAIFADHTLSETMERAKVKTHSIIDTILSQQLLIAEENAILAAQRSAVGTRQSRSTTGKASARFRSNESSAAIRRTSSVKKQSKRRENAERESAEKTRARRSSKQNPAMVAAKTRSRVGKSMDFGTSGMTLAELGIVENYSFE